MLKSHSPFASALPVLAIITLTMTSIGALAQTLPTPLPEKPKQSGFVSPDGTPASVLSAEQKQVSDETADLVFQNEMRLRVIQSQLALAKAKAEIAKLGPEAARIETPVMAAKPVSVANVSEMTTSAIPVAVSAAPEKKPEANLETKFKIIKIVGSVDHLVATLKVDRLGAIQVKKNDVVPNFNLTVLDIDRRTVRLKTATGEVISIPFVM